MNAPRILYVVFWKHLVPMLDITTWSQVFIVCGATDLRKSFNGLCAIIKLSFNLDPYSRCMFVFCNRSRNLIKILQWDGSGLWLYIKKLDRGSFRWPMNASEVKQISARELRWLCEGLSLEQKNAFKDRHPTIVI